MKNDAKLGMLAGVLGVIVAAVLFANTPPPAVQSRPNPTGEPKATEEAPPAATVTAPPTASPAAANATALSSTPVRTRKETGAQPASRSGGTEEEP